MLNGLFGRWQTVLKLALAAALAASAGSAAVARAGGVPAYRAERPVAGAINSIGDPAMVPLMNAWLAAFQKKHPGIARGPRWDHRSAATAVGALIFETTDLAPLSREPLAAELAPYAHQFHGDMMKAPVMVRVASLSGRPAFVAVNKRPGSPLPPKVKEFLSFALSREGQRIVAMQQGFSPLDPPGVAAERAKIDGYLAVLDPALPSYRATTRVTGEIRSVGSDGMKTLMDRWARNFHRLQPGVTKGERWEHVGTLNGFHALLAGETDIAPMGRELWPEELAIYKEAVGENGPLEIRVARGGFNTPQRTTAQAIFVHANNPIAQISVPQLAAIFGASPTIRRWGDLGLNGSWANRPITVYSPPRIAPNAMSMQTRILGGRAWNEALKEGTIDKTAAAIAADVGGIGFGGFEEGGPGLKTLAVATKEGAPYLAGTYEHVSNGHYPLMRYMYIRLRGKPGEPVSPAVKEFLRYILSKQGQEPILYSGYFPLTAEEVAEELEKLK